MTVISIDDGGNDSAKTRLLRAADAEIAERGINAIQMEAIAKRAGVSRATAFRQLGGLSEAVVQVALLRAERHVDVVSRLMAVRTGAFEKLEAAFIYNARELPKDPAIAELMSRRSESVHDPRSHGQAMMAAGPVLEEGQRNGEIRTDLPLDEIIDFIVEQTFLAAEEIDRSEEAVRRRMRHFIVPAIEARDARGGEFRSGTREVETAISNAMAALQNLSTQLKRRGRDGDA
ncbi:TetR family transcriptional regulator [Mycobacterium colombiense]|uniref:TetR/AcrR family transcriptional regulator n=1 Tax=Mycobacterium colombiense TaxID=339268 RepID=UPI0007EF689D|nr:TetR/AcrR family transcriptional regulator [Mycobacterium colombiense]OBK63262.1 TetR family transcriptional regulator [Mycobacterium colombiense]